MIQAKFGLENSSFEIVIEFSFNVEEGFSPPYKHEGTIIWIDSITHAEQHLRYKFICSAVMLNRHLCFEPGEDDMLVLVPDLIVPVHIFSVALEWEEDQVDFFLNNAVIWY